VHLALDRCWHDPDECGVEKHSQLIEVLENVSGKWRRSALDPNQPGLATRVDAVNPFGPVVSPRCVRGDVAI
jgi:hypothetical protein